MDAQTLIPVQSSGRPRRGFTLIEVLVVVGIIALLAGLLLPVLSKMRRSAQITTMKLNFQTISIALEAYYGDFNGYPQNGFASTDPYGVARSDGSLAMAMVGPGPASYANGYLKFDVDGADGPGFRTTNTVVTPPIAIASTASAGNHSVTLSTALPIAVTVVSFGVNSSDPHIAIASGGSVGSTQITLVTPLVGTYNTGTLVGLLAPSGKIWGPYIPADRFKISYVNGLPQLIDPWNQPILYFPAYNHYTNNTTAPNANVNIGPLLGAASPGGTGNQPDAGPAVFWDGPINGLFNAGQRNALLFKLGDHTGANAILNSTLPPEAFNVNKPYFLVSAGPDGLFQDLSSVTDVGAWPAVMAKSDDIYSFDP